MCFCPVGGQSRGEHGRGPKDLPPPGPGRAERRPPAGAATAHLLRSGGSLPGQATSGAAGTAPRAGAGRCAVRAGAQRPRAQPRSAFLAVGPMGCGRPSEPPSVASDVAASPRRATRATPRQKRAAERQGERQAGQCRRRSGRRRGVHAAPHLICGGAATQWQRGVPRAAGMGGGGVFSERCGRRQISVAQSCAPESVDC
jgi:hypothetical protein